MPVVSQGLWYRWWVPWTTIEAPGGSSGSAAFKRGLKVAVGVVTVDGASGPVCVSCQYQKDCSSD